MAELPVLSGAIPVRTLWQANIGAAGRAVFSPAVAAGSVFAAAQDGTVARLEAGSGRQVWRVNAGQPLSGGVGADGSLVVVGTAQGEVIALDATDGKVRWRARVSSEVLAPPAMTGDVVVVRSADSRLFAFDARDGKRRWVSQRSTPTLTVRSPVGIAAARGLVFAGFSGGKLVAIVLANGALRWEATVALPRGATELERVTDVVGLPWISESAKSARSPTRGASPVSTRAPAICCGRAKCRPASRARWRSTRVTCSSPMTRARCTPSTAPVARASGSRTDFSCAVLPRRLRSAVRSRSATSRASCTCCRARPGPSLAALRPMAAP